MTNGVWAVVPVKRLADAKSRLAPALGCVARSELARAMFEDVLGTLLRCGGLLAGTIIVTADEAVAAIATRRGALVIFEDEDHGINAAVHRALAHAALDADAGILVVPSDVPQVSPAAIATAVAAIAKPRTLAIAAASKDGGTNLLACRPASAVPLHFGAHSCREHMRAARQSGLSVAVLRMPELMLDIDRSEDLDLFQALHTKTRTHALLSKLRSAVPGTGALATEGAH